MADILPGKVAMFSVLSISRLTTDRPLRASLSLFYIFRMNFRGGIFVLVLLTAAKVNAQNMLYVEHKGQMYPVRKAVESRAYVRYDGKLVQASGDKFALYKTEEYL